MASMRKMNSSMRCPDEVDKNGRVNITRDVRTTRRSRGSNPAHAIRDEEEENMFRMHDGSGASANVLSAFR